MSPLFNFWLKSDENIEHLTQRSSQLSVRMWNEKSLINVRGEKVAEKVRHALYIQFTFTQDVHFWGDNYKGDINAPALLRCAGFSDLWPSALIYMLSICGTFL